MYAEDIQQLVLGLLAQTEFANAASQAFDAVETIQEDLDGLLQQKDQRGLLSIKVGTTLLLAILGKVQMGKLPQSFRKEDWVDIADSVAAYALRMDGKDYSAFVFTLYADCRKGKDSFLYFPPPFNNPRRRPHHHAGTRPHNRRRHPRPAPGPQWQVRRNVERPGR